MNTLTILLLFFGFITPLYFFIGVLKGKSSNFPPQLALCSIVVLILTLRLDAWLLEGGLIQLMLLLAQTLNFANHEQNKGI